MKTWQNFYKKKNGNSFPNTSLVTFYYRKFYNLKRKLLFLDLGCGSGSSALLYKKNNIYLDAVDISKLAIEKFKKKKLSKKRFLFYNSTFNKFLQNSKKKYDFIYDGASLQHQKLVDIKKSYKLIYQNLKKNGYFLTIHLQSYKDLSSKDYFVTELTKKKIISLLKKEKFKSIDYNNSYYTENNSKSYIKFNVVSVKK